MELYDYVFHFNPHTQLWNAVHRDSYTHYWNGVPNTEILTARDVSVLVELISKGRDFIESVQKTIQ